MERTVLGENVVWFVDVRGWGMWYGSWMGNGGVRGRWYMRNRCVRGCGSGCVTSTNCNLQNRNQII